MKCLKCGTEYNGNFCPGCGAQAQQPQVQKKKGLKAWQTVLIVVGGVFLLAGIASSISGNTKNANAPVASGQLSDGAAVQSADLSKSEEQYIEVTAHKLLDDFDTNQVNAEQIYKGKKLKITGTVETIAKDILDKTYITLDSEKDFAWNVQCYFSDKDESQKLASLSPGDKVTVIGEYDDFVLNVVVKKCTLSN